MTEKIGPLNPEFELPKTLGSLKPLRKEAFETAEKPTLKLNELIFIFRVIEAIYRVSFADEHNVQAADELKLAAGLIEGSDEAVDIRSRVQLRLILGALRTAVGYITYEVAEFEGKEPSLQGLDNIQEQLRARLAELEEKYQQANS